MTVAAVLLAAGRSTRFGASDKLAAPFRGLPLGHHAARALMPLPLGARIVVSAGAMDWPGFDIVRTDRLEAGQAHSLALGVAAARERGAEAVLVALADMPLVPTAHFARLLDRYSRPDTLVATADGARRMPPALFGADWFAALESLSGDQGARALLADAAVVVAPPGTMIDVDRPEDLAGLGTGLS